MVNMYNSIPPLVLLLLPTGVLAGFYDCTDGVECSATYGPPTVGTQADVEAACDADASCVAFQYNTGQVRPS
jgi:hypothetical protein